MIPGPPKVYVIDDDESVRRSLCRLVRCAGYEVEALATSEAYLALTAPAQVACLVVDMRMPGMSGLDLFDILRERGSRMPVIFLTGHGDVPLAVAALKKGAFDFFEKPFNDNDLVTRIQEAMEHDARQRAASASANSVNSRLSTLTTRERQIMELVLAGKFNKVIADELNISMRTVEVHRANLFDKMGVKTAVELANLIKMGH